MNAPTAFTTFSLQSGSNGNSIYVASGSTRILVDAGISGKKAKNRLASHHVDFNSIDATIISHNHGDHAGCAGIYTRMFGAELFITEKTLNAVSHRLGKVPRLNHFVAGGKLQIGDITVETIPTPHDGVDGACFVFDNGHKRLGVLTDLGHVFNGLSEVVNSLDAVYLESNFDPEMLETGPYPYPLKERVRGNGGHISNVECAQLLDDAFRKKLQWAALSHLSEENNTPQLALQTAQQITGKPDQIRIASRYGVTPLFTV